MKKSQSVEASTAIVKEVSPLIVDNRGAALMIARSAAWLQAQRSVDLKRIEQGQEPVGPRWCSFGKGNVYKVDDLRTWLDRQLVEHGRVPFRGDLGGEP